MSRSHPGPSRFPRLDGDEARQLNNRCANRSAADLVKESVMTQDRPQDRPQDRSPIAKDAASSRESALKAADVSLSAKRTAEDEQIAQRRLTEDETLADARRAAVAGGAGRATAEAGQAARRRRTEDETLADARLAENREVASTLNRVNVASAAMQAACDGGDIAAVHAANDELQSAVREHLSAVPEPLPVRGADDTDVLITRLQIAASLTAQGKHAEAEAEYRDLLAVRARIRAQSSRERP